MQRGMPVMLSNMERVVLHNVLDRLNEAREEDPNRLGPWLSKHIIAPLEILFDAEHIYDRHKRQMQLETARSFSREQGPWDYAKWVAP